MTHPLCAVQAVLDWLKKHCGLQWCWQLTGDPESLSCETAARRYDTTLMNLVLWAPVTGHAVTGPVVQAQATVDDMP
jgi:hypothetical protein